MGDNSKDLATHIPDAVIKNQVGNRQPSYFVDVDGLVHKIDRPSELILATRCARRILAEYNWFEKFTTHRPSIGTFYENLLRSIIEEMSPSTSKVGEGFVFDASTHTCSAQLDIIVYSDRRRAPLYRQGNFVVVLPSAVTSLAEVKKTLSVSDIRKIIRKHIGEFLGSRKATPWGLQYLNVFCYRSRSSTAALLNALKEETEAYLKNFASQTNAGHTALLGMRHLVLTQVFFLDREEYISATLHQRDKGTEQEVHFSVCSSGAAESLNMFLYSMAPSPEYDLSGGENDFVTYPLLAPICEVKLKTTVFLFRELSMDELLRYFPAEIRRLAGKVIDGRRPYGAVVDSNIDISRLNSLNELQNQLGFRWLLTPDLALSRAETST